MSSTLIPKPPREARYPQQLLRRHPELETELHVWMAATDRWKFAVRRDPRDQTRKAGQIGTQAHGEEGTN
jgi:hypothetical protein